MDPENLSNLGMIALQQGDLERGVQWLAKSLQARPEQPTLLAIRAVGLRLLGRLDEALESCNRAIVLRPDYPEAHFDRGTILQALKLPDEALSSYDRAILLRPDYAEAHNNRGTALQQLRRLNDALASYERAVALRPDYADPYNNRGTVLQDLWRLDEALAGFDRAIALKSNYAEAYANRSAVLLALQRPRDALADSDRALALKPDYAQAHTNRGAVLHELLRLDEALQSYDRAIALDPDAAAAYWGKSTLKILTGQYEEGWRLYEWRWNTAQKQFARHFAQPSWTGQQSIQGKTLLIHAEQGQGDFIQFCRYAPMAQALGAKVVLEVPGALLSVIATLKGNFRIVERGAPLPRFDLHCPVMSLPHAFKTTLQTIPSRVPYLDADPDKRTQWQAQLGPKTRARVGLAWSGSAWHRNDRNRSVPLQQMEPLFSHPVEFHSIQKEPRPEDSALMRHIPLRPHSDQLKDFSDAAALIREMDLVICVDTSVAHLAGALSAPVWILLPFTPDCRWMLDRSDSPWYPTATLIRQPEAGDWRSVIADVSRRLAHWSSN
jgi:hypothetical protein